MHLSVDREAEQIQILVTLAHTLAIGQCTELLQKMYRVAPEQLGTMYVR
jgi:hypothetical protein